MASLGAAMGGEGTADKIPGGSLPALVLGRLGYPAGAGAPRLVSAEWRGEANRLYGRELEIQVALRDPHNELLTHFLNSAVRAGDIEEARRLIRRIALVLRVSRRLYPCREVPQSTSQGPPSGIQATGGPSPSPGSAEVRLGTASLCWPGT